MLRRVSGAIVCLVLGCGGGAKQERGGELESKSEEPVAPLTELPLVAGFAVSVEEAAPSDNQLTEARAQLGRRLFYDTQLSRDGSISCASCHQQEFGFSDPRPVSRGVADRRGRRNASQLANLAWVQSGLFWDGRAATLEEQASQPIQDPLEMDLPLEEAIARLNAEAAYVEAFEEAYGGPPNLERLEKALASFVRTLVSAGSPYDRYLAGDVEALSAAEERGRAIFLGEGGCFHCHSEGTLTNDGFFNNGTYEEGGDPGRQALTDRTGDLGKFRVPHLRNVGQTAPYMHDGSLSTLEAVVEHYDQGGRGHESTDVQIAPLLLSDSQKEDLVAFLNALSDPDFLTDPRFAQPEPF